MTIAMLTENFYAKLKLSNILLNIKNGQSLLFFPLILFLYDFLNTKFLYYFYIKPFHGGIAALYFDPVMLASLFTEKFYILFYSLLFLFCALGWKKLSWEFVDSTEKYKYFLTVIALVLAWKYSSYGYNYYLDQWHMVDRLVLVLSAIAIFYHPIAVPFFISFAYVMMSQFNFPLGGFSLTDVKPLFDVLVLFSVFLGIRYFVKIKIEIFFIVALTLHASNYFYPAIAKFDVSPHLYEWVLYHDLHYFIINTYFRGWLGFLNQDIVFQVSQYISWLNVPFNIVTMILQFGALLIFLNRRMALIFLIGFEILHFGVFFASGIFFWKWIILNLGFIVLLKKYHEEHLMFIFQKKYFVSSIVIILAAPLYFSPVWLGWFNTNAGGNFYIEVEDSKKQVYEFSYADLQPYQKPFVFERILYSFLEDKVLTRGFGAVPVSASIYENGKIKNDFELKSIISNVGVEGYLGLVNEEGVSLFNQRSANKIENFLIRYFKNMNKDLNKSGFLQVVQAPNHIYAGRNNKYEFKSPVKKVYIRYKTWYHDKTQVYLLNDRVVKEIEIL